MKITILFLILSFPFICFSQNWADNNSVWHYDQTDYGPPFNDVYIQFSEIGDTVILGDTAKIVKEEYISLLDTISNNIFVKSDSNRVYLYVAETNSFELMYDFNALPGDTIHVYCRGGLSPVTTIHILVDSVSTIEINDNILKLQYVSQPNLEEFYMTGTIIENIGWTGFMFPLHSWVDPPYGGALRCFQNDVIGLYHLSSFDCDYIETDIESIVESVKIQVFPNPAYDNIYISIEECATLEILNVQGKIVDTKSLLEKTNTLDISKLASGVYTLRIKTDRGVAIRKLVKQ